MKKLTGIFAALLCCIGVSAAGLDVMTFNMRYDNPEDGANNWRFRRDRVASVITTNDIEVFGAQELLANQFRDLKKRLPQYEAVGVGREDGKKKGEFCPVFFKRDRFTLLDSGTFWLSETPEKAGSKGWDGACERLATWVVLHDKHDGTEFLFINTHLDHRGLIARREGVTLLMERIATLAAGRAVILTGDFNAHPASDVIAHVNQGGVLHDVKPVAAEHKGPDWSFHDFGQIPEASRPLIDYIFVSPGITASRYEVLPAQLDGVYVSDHAPVMAVIEIANN